MMVRAGAGLEVFFSYQFWRGPHPDLLEVRGEKRRAALIIENLSRLQLTKCGFDHNRRLVLNSDIWYKLVLAIAVGSLTATVTFAASFDARKSTVSNPSANHYDRAAPTNGDLGQHDSAAQTAPTSRQTDLANPLWAIPLESLQATRERPMFSASRRPPPVPPAVIPVPILATEPSSAAEPEKPLIKLIGVVHGESQGIGLFVSQGEKTPVRLRIGKEDNGWRLRTVGVREVTLKKGDQEVTLELPLRDSGEVAELTPQKVVAIPIRRHFGALLKGRPPN